VEFSGRAHVDHNRSVAQVCVCILHGNLARPPEKEVAESEDRNEGDENPFHRFRLTRRMMSGLRGIGALCLYHLNESRVKSGSGAEVREALAGESVDVDAF